MLLLPQVVQFLLSCGFSVHSKNDEGETPLHTAAIKVGGGDSGEQEGK